ncbi:MAG: ComF family protein [Nitrospirae bacterium]|nr:ComF family protein [Nitrospirota bacterium]
MRQMRGITSDRLIAGLINAVYPSSCPSCEGPSDSFVYAPFCTGCWSGLRKYSGAACRLCATPFTSGYSGLCGGCIEDPPAYSGAAYFGLYEGVLAAAIHAFKFQGTRRLGRPLGRLMAGADLNDIDAVIAVPLSVRGIRDRGFNQSLLLAKAVSDEAGITLLLDGLYKASETPPQLGLSKEKRKQNLKGAFKSSSVVSGLRLLLVDDVMTTGATVAECARELIGAGAEEVRVLTLARAGNL